MEIKTDEHGKQYINVLNHGYVKLDHYVGTDQFIMEEARKSTYRDSEIDRQAIVNAIRYMMKDGFKHKSPFEQAVLWFEIKGPIHIIKMFNRHRTARILEKSARYTEMAKEFYIPDFEDYKLRMENVVMEDGSKLSEEELLELHKEITELITIHNNRSYELYEILLKEYNMPKEMARTTLPISLYTTERFQIDLHNLMNFLSLRVSKHAQYEAQMLAEAMLELAKLVFPICIEEFENQLLEGKHFSKRELDALKISIENVEHLTKHEQRNLHNKLSKILNIGEE